MIKIKFIFPLIIMFLICCGPGMVGATTYKYTVKNKSGVPIVVNSYNTSSPRPEEIVFKTFLEDGQAITKTYRDVLPPQGYTFSDFFGALEGSSSTDSIKVIYDGIKQKDFGEFGYRKTYVDGKTVTPSKRNPLRHIYGGGEPGITFIFTKEDYENAEDCNGSCE